MPDRSKLSRREFIKDAAIGTAAVAGAGILGATGAQAQTPSQPWLPAKWDYESELVIVGYGGAGAVTAITAADAGAKVLILEKQPADTPTRINQTNSTRTCASAMMSFYSKEAAISFLKFSSRGATPDDVIASWAEYATHTEEWVKGIGGEFGSGVGVPAVSEFPEGLVPGDKQFDRVMHKDNGPGLWKTLSTAVAARKVDILFESPAKELIQDPVTKEILGVVAENKGKKIYVKAKKAVALMCGGFEYDFEMLSHYALGYPIRFYANPGNTGDGIKMAQAVGAALWHMPLIGGRVIPYFPELGHGCMGGTPSPFILVNKYGKRFLRWPWRSHSAVYEAIKWDTDLCDFPASPCFSVFDQSAVDKGPVVTASGMGPLAMGHYTWSKDNSEEIKKGWILKGQTIEELAAVIAKDPEDAGKMKAAVLADTLKRYNQYCAEGVDPEFGNSKATLIPLAKPPFYALKMYPGGVNTFGGPKRNAKGQVVNSLNNPIPRLYSGGELGSILGFLYSGGGWNICEIVVSGQIAAKNALAEKPWDVKA